jgi:hypothetical protein
MCHSSLSCSDPLLHHQFCKRFGSHLHHVYCLLPTCSCVLCRFDGRALLETLPPDQSDADASAAQEEAPASEGGAKLDSFLSFERYR